MSVLLELGGVYKVEWDERPFKVIAFDEVEVFYDCRWPHDEAWGFKNTDNASYYRTLTSVFTNRAKQIGKETLDYDEMLLYRPDLPLRLCRFNDFNWQERVFTSKEDLKQFSFYEALANKYLNTAEIVLKPLGKNGRTKKGKKITAEKEELSYLELIYHANNMQSAYVQNAKSGIGLYRIGVEKRLPSYYIGNYYDNADHIKYYEEQKQ